MPLDMFASLRRFTAAAALAVALTFAGVGLSSRAQDAGKPAPKTDPAGKADTKTPPEPKPDPKADPKDLKVPDPKDPKDRPMPIPDEKEKRPAGDDGIDLKVLLRRTVPGVSGTPTPTNAQLPQMALRGWVRVAGKPPAALLEIKGLARFVLVREGMDLPVSVVGKLPASFARTPDGRTADSVDREQIRLKVRKVSAEGVELDHPLFVEPLIVR